MTPASAAALFLELARAELRHRGRRGTYTAANVRAAREERMAAYEQKCQALRVAA